MPNHKIQVKPMPTDNKKKQFKSMPKQRNQKNHQQNKYQINKFIENTTQINAESTNSIKSPHKSTQNQSIKSI